jgi:hypothetical protein
MSDPKNLLVELFVEELPPKALKKLGEAFATVLADSLKAQGLAGRCGGHAFASPRRLAVHVSRRRGAGGRPARAGQADAGGVALDAAGQAHARAAEEAGALGPMPAPAAAAQARRSTARPRRCSSTPCARRHAGRRPAEGAGRGHRQAAHPQGHAVPAGRRLEQRALRAPGAWPGGAARRRRGALSRRSACRRAAARRATASRRRCRRSRCATPTATRPAARRRRRDRQLCRAPRRDRAPAAAPRRRGPEAHRRRRAAGRGDGAGRAAQRAAVPLRARVPGRAAGMPDPDDEGQPEVLPAARRRAG